MNYERMNEALKGKTIVSVEEGTTPGWVVLNFDPIEFNAVEGTRVYMTIFVGGRKEQTSEDSVHWLCALHVQEPERWGIADPIRDGRDPRMPMGKAWRHSSLIPKTENTTEPEDAVETAANGN